MSKIDKEQNSTVFKKLGIFCVLCISLYLIAISAFPVMHNLAGGFERNGSIRNLILLLIGTGSLFGIIRFIKKNGLFEQLLGPIRKFARRWARLISMVFFAASAALFLIVLIMVASMVWKCQPPILIRLEHLLIIGIHVFVFFSIGRKFRRTSVAASQVNELG